MLSVVTITRNNFRELVATVESLAGAGAGCALELVVVDGGTCPDTARYLEALAPAGMGFRYLREPDTGISDAFNKGVRLARGDAVVFLNSGDTLISRGYYPRAMAALAQDPGLGFVHAAIVFEDRVAGDLVLRPSLSSLGRGMPYRHQTMIVRKAVFDRIGVFDTGLRAAMDFDFVCRMHKAGVRGHYDRVEPVVRMDGGGISSTREMFGYGEVLRVLRRHGLLTPANLGGTVVRYATYFVRRGLERAGLGGVLAWLKRRKHSDAIPPAGGAA